MRAAFSEAMLTNANDPSFIFLTGDLGFNALEKLREILGRRFINAGVAEQNMIAVAAGLASEGFRPWVYSIAPFLYARALEHIRNDISLHRLPVTIVGNGGGYGYGVMGATHHALEDYGILSTLSGMRSYVPAFDEDIPPIVEKIKSDQSPAYLRLGLSELPSTFQLPSYESIRRLVDGDGSTLLIVGPLIGGLLEQLKCLERSQRPETWVITEIPFTENSLSAPLIESIQRTGKLIVAEEHVAIGSVGHSIAAVLLRYGIKLSIFRHLFAQGYPSGRYGSQKYHRKESGIDVNSILAEISRHSR